MGSKNLSFIINLHHLYIKVDKTIFPEYEEEGSLIFRTISDIYLPLLKMLSSLEKSKVKAKIGLVFSAGVCALLADDEVKKGFNKWLSNLIAFAKREVSRTRLNPSLNRIAKEHLDAATEKKRLFNEIYSGDLLAAFGSFAEKGYVEILATCGTYIFMPHFSDMQEILNAQVESGLYTIKTCFGKMPDGFFLPEMGYAPGIEKILKLYGVEYTILSNQSFLFSKTPPQNGIFSPARFYNSLAVFSAEHFQGEANPVYKNLNKDLSWELTYAQLSPFVKAGHARHSSGFSYHNFDEQTYNPKLAAKQIKEDAKAFFTARDELLTNAQKLIGENSTVSLGIYLDCFRRSCLWCEAFQFLEAVIRTAVAAGVNVTSYADLLDTDYTLQKIEPYLAACSGSPYGENLVSNANGWMMRYLRKANERIVDLASRFPNDGALKVRLLNLGAKELMLVQDCTLAKMIDSNTYSKFASEYFKRGIVSFSNVYDALGSNTLSTEWFCALEKMHPIFPWMNYRIFARKH